ncbi:MAG: hypothetical protein AAF968_01175 [Pseudomonadota bacterium]
MRVSLEASGRLFWQPMCRLERDGARGPVFHDRFDEACCVSPQTRGVDWTQTGFSFGLEACREADLAMLEAEDPKTMLARTLPRRFEIERYPTLAADWTQPVSPE